MWANYFNTETTCWARAEGGAGRRRETRTGLAANEREIVLCISWFTSCFDVTAEPYIFIKRFFMRRIFLSAFKTLKVYLICVKHAHCSVVYILSLRNKYCFYLFAARVIYWSERVEAGATKGARGNGASTAKVMRAQCKQNEKRK